MQKQKTTNLLLFVIGTELIGALSGIVSGGNFKTFYNSLNQPPFAPPGWLFPVMWAILYATMGVSAYLVYQSEHSRKESALILYFIQLFLNFLWSPVFFRFKSLTGATVVILLLLILVILMIVRFWGIRKSAALLNIPYLLWIIFAAYLTIGFLLLN